MFLSLLKIAVSEVIYQINCWEKRWKGKKELVGRMSCIEEGKIRERKLTLTKCPLWVGAML